MHFINYSVVVVVAGLSSSGNAGTGTPVKFTVSLPFFILNGLFVVLKESPS